MLKKLPSQPFVISYQFEGEITATDVDTIYDDLGRALERNEKVSFFAELIGEFDINRAAVWRDITRAHEVLGHFRQFDRVAFVAEPSWIRAIARAEESVLALFDFNLHVFDVSERDRAMAWVNGRSDETDAPSIREIPSFDPNIAVFEIDGKMRKSDMVIAKDIMLKFTNEEQPRNLLAIIKNFAGFELGILADRDLITLKLQAASNLDRYAIVGAPGWMEGYIETMDNLLKPQLRAFDADDRDEAIAWLTSDELVA